MKHPAAQPENITDDVAKALLHSREVSSAFSKAMAIVCVEGKPVDLVHCHATLYRSLAAIFRRRRYGERFFVSIVWMPCGEPGTKVDSLYLARDLWDALCENEEAMIAYFEITGVLERGDA